LKQFPRSRRASEVLYQSAQCYYHLSKYDEAISAYQKYLQQDPRGNLSLLAGLGLGSCFEEKSEFDKAATAYSKAIVNNPNDPLLGEAFVSLARCQEATGKKDDAVKTYKQLVEKFPNSSWKLYAERKLLYLKSH
jgi:TolA-binding protein